MEGSVQLCDFIWQHECRKKWITYNEEEMTILNKAIKKKQKTVKLPSSNIKKEIIVHLDKMYQKNQVTSYEQRVRCGVYNNGFYSWSWQDDGDWHCYPAFVVLLLEIAYEQKKEKLSVYLNGDLEIDLINFIEINEQTKTSRPINRDCLEIPLVSVEGMMITANCKNHVRKIASEVNLSQSFVLPEVSASASVIEEVQSSIMTVGMTPLNTEEEVSLNPEDLRCVPVDPECQEHENFHLYFENGVLFTATLNLTSLQKNSNKFYIIQVLEHNKRKQYCVWRRWGRVGSKGQNELVKYGSNIEAAKEGFAKKFFEKTHNNWNNKSKFVKHDGKYDLLKIDLSSGITVHRTTATESQPTESKLDPKLQSLLNLICDKKLMEEVMKEMNYDSKRTPLGNLTTSQIHAGYAALGEIVQLLNSGGKGSALVSACNNFYTKIPHDFGRKTPTIITTLEQVQEKLKMLEALGNINVAMDLMDERMDIDEDPLDKYYRKLKCHLTVLDHSSEEFAIIENCIQTTHGRTHNNYSMTVIEIFSCKRELESESFLNYGNVMLLWHGSRLTNWLGILKEGLQIAPREELITGSLFGKGIYFADVSSKSANYCKATKKNDEGLLLLCEVSLGQQLYLYDNEDINLQLPEGYHSVAGIGSIKPSSYDLGVLSTEAKLPGGPLIEDNTRRCYLKYNEYVVYDPKQIKMRYLVRVKFNFK